MNDTVLLTDYAWPDDAVERHVIESAGMRLVSGPSTASSSLQIEDLVREHQPAAILTCWAPVSAQAIDLARGLKIVARLGVGLDNISVDAATARNVIVTNVPDYCVEEVSDHAVGLALAWTRGLVQLDREVRAGRWVPAEARLRRLATLTCGLIGYGRIGRATARKLSAFGCRLMAHDPFMPKDAPGIQPVGLDDLLSQSDIVIVHAPLTDSTHHLLNRERIRRMRRGSLLINVSRGAIVDSGAVIEALHDGHLAAAGLDVLESEPDVPAALLSSDGALLTPHVAFLSDASLLELRTRAAEEVVRVLRGEAPRNPCNLQRP